MTDETKGDGMTLADIRKHHATIAAIAAKDGRMDDMRKHGAFVDAIDAHLAAQSAMRVDEAMVERAYGAYRENCCTEAFPWLERSAMRAALQAAVGGKE